MDFEREPDDGTTFAPDPEAETLKGIARRYAAGETLHPDELDAVRAHVEANAPDAVRDALDKIETAESKKDREKALLDALREVVQQADAPRFADAVRSTFPVDPDPPEWLCPDWIPANAVTVLTGRGGAGKSRIALQLAVSVATQRREFLQLKGAGAGGFPAPRLRDADPANVVFATWETSEAAFDWRLKCTIDGARCGHVNLENRFVHADMRSAAGGGMWGVKQGAHVSTAGGILPAGANLLELAAERKARLLVVDPVAAAFMQNENDRALVRAFLAYLGAWAEQNACAVLLISHPPKYSGAAQSGSTDWRNGVQAVLDLGPEHIVNGNKLETLQSERRVLRVDKLNEGAAPEGVTLQWETETMRFETCPPTPGAALWTGTEWAKLNADTPENNEETSGEIEEKF